MYEDEVAETINATNFVEGVSPQWNEMIYADIADDKSLSEGKFRALCTNDGMSYFTF